MSRLRPYQSKLKAEIVAAWAASAPVVMAVSPTGTGKTVLFSDLIRDEPGASLAIAHRKEIVTQISLALAKNGVRHRIVGQDKTRKACQRLHLRKLGRHFIDPNAKCGVAGINTLVGIKETDAAWQWLQQVKLWIGDEGHHFLDANTWGKGVRMVPNARGLLVTATPRRADGKGLGRHADGIADVMVLGPTMREAIDMGYLVDYIVAMPESDVDIRTVEISSTGDYNQTQLRDAFHKSTKICGDTVKAYQKYTPGKLAVVFAVDVEESVKTARAFNDAGIPAASVDANTPDEIRDDVMRRFEARELLVLCNVDLFGEGYDLPNLEVVVMARHTASFALYAQQWGRGARLDIPKEWMDVWDTYSDAERRALIATSRKPAMFLIDLVGNVHRHNGPPDCTVAWTLDRRASGTSGGGADDAIPTRVCMNKDKHGDQTGIACAKRYERVLPRCPYCGHIPDPPSRSSPEAVDGDLTLLDSSACAALYQAKLLVDRPAADVADGQSIVARSIRNKQHARQLAQAALRKAIVWWFAWETGNGRADLQQQYRRFYFQFGTDVATAQTLGATEATALATRVSDALAILGIDATVSID